MKIKDLALVDIITAQLNNEKQTTYISAPSIIRARFSKNGILRDFVDCRKRKGHPLGRP